MESKNIQACPVFMEIVKKRLLEERLTTIEIFEVAIKENWFMDELDAVIKIKKSIDNDNFNETQRKILETLQNPTPNGKTITDEIETITKVEKIIEEESEDFYMKKIQKEPFNAKLHHDYASYLYESGKKEESLKEDYEAVKIDKDNAEVHYCIGNTLEDLNRLQEAMLEYKTAISLSPDYIDAYYNLGVVCNKLNKSEEAKKMFDMVEKLEKIKGIQ